MRTPRFAWLVHALMALLAFPALAQDPNSSPVEVPDDEFDRGTPVRTASGFIAAAEAGDFETAAEYLDLRNLRGEANELSGPQLARRLYVVVMRGNWVDIDELIDDPAGRPDDGQPSYRDSIGVVLDDDKELRLLMQKVPRGDGVFIWKVSNATVSLIPELYEEYGYPEPVEQLRRALPNVSLVGIELFKWVIILTAAATAYVLVFLVAFTIRRSLGDPDTPSHRRIFRFLVVPFGLWTIVIVMNAIAEWLGRGEAAETLQRASPIPIIITVWVLFATINLFRDIYSNHLERAGRRGAQVLLSPAGNAIKLLVLISAVLIYLDKLGIDITTVLAGLGVGGIAVALALQKPMEDVLGAITLYAQQPIKVGDFCRIGNALGTIESIGLRTTRIRTLQNTVIAAPNSKVASEPIDNISARERILYWPMLRLRYDTSPDQIRQILDGIREHLASHARVFKENYRVRFKEIAEDALLIEVYVNLETDVWAEYLELVEELNLELLEIIDRAGTSLALPARTLHIEGNDEFAESVA